MLVLDLSPVTRIGDTYLDTILEVYVPLPHFYKGLERFDHFYPFSPNIREEASKRASIEHQIPTFASNCPSLCSSTMQP